MPASVQDMQNQGHIPAEGAIEMIERGFPPAILAPLQPAQPQLTKERRESDVSTMVQRDASPRSVGVAAAEAAVTPSSPLQRRRTPFAEASNPLQVLVVDDDP
jgi:hypothetical protein